MNGGEKNPVGWKRVSKSVIEKQQTRLHKLIGEHAEILSSTADDEPLKSRIWLNIAEELNKLSECGPHLTPKEWQKYVDWHKYTARRGRKPIKRSTMTDTIQPSKRLLTNLEKSKFKIVNETELEENKQQEASAFGKLDLDPANFGDNIHENNKPEDEVSSLNDDVEVLINDDIDAEVDIINSSELNNGSDYNGNTAPYWKLKKSINVTPIVRSFTYSQRIMKCVENLGNDVYNIQEQLHQTVNNMNRLEFIMQEQIRQHQLTNRLLKRNGHLLKILAQCKCGSRTNPSN